VNVSIFWTMLEQSSHLLRDFSQNCICVDRYANNTIILSTF